jgi:D-glycero-alpha-D-manno-heptose-7-phosphate kinase
LIISRTPLRISFAGGGSDLPSFYRRQPGAVVTTAIDKYIYIGVNRNFDEKIRASYSTTEIVDSPHQLKNELLRESLKLVGVEAGVEVTSVSDIPSEGTGLGSSSAFTVGVLHALHAYTGRVLAPERLAREACCVEIERCSKPIGKQDQYIAAYGGFQYIQFDPDDTVRLYPIVCSAETKRRLQDGLLLLYTGMARSAREVLEEQKTNIDSNWNRRRSVEGMVRLAQELRDALRQDDLSSFGDILHRGWMMKRSLASTVSNSRIDDWYERARSHGALGGKILGAGGGGFLLLYALPERHPEILAALPELGAVPVRFEQKGSTIVYREDNRHE